MLTNVCSAITYNVEAPNGISAAPGGSVEYKITVGDTGLPIDERFDLSAHPKSGLSFDWSYNFEPQYIIVPSVGSNFTVLTIKVPPGIEAGTYEHNVSINGSIDDPEFAEFADLTMEVVPNRCFNSRVPYSRGSSGCYFRSGNYFRETKVRIMRL